MTAQFEISARYEQLRPQVVLLDPAGVVVLKESRGRRFWLVFGSLLAAVWGFGMALLNTDSWRGWAGMLIFCAGIALFIIQLLRPDSLTLTRDGFSYRNLGRSERRAWSDVAEFGILAIRRQGGTTRQVGIRYKNGNTLVRTMVSGLDARFDFALPDTYRLSVYELLALMEEWRAAASRH
ncbi:MAG TPA: hypothetical protein VGJ60_18485 [Chloroflexota bacterium]